MGELVSFRMEKEFLHDLRHIVDEEQSDQSSALRKILELGIFEWKKADVVRHILNGSMSLSKAAAVLGVSYYQMLEILRDKKAAFIAIRKDELEEEINAAKKG